MQIKKILMKTDMNKSNIQANIGKKTTAPIKSGYMVMFRSVYIKH